MAIYKPAYQIIRTEKFIQKAHDLGKVYPRIPQLIQAVDWALERKPHSFSCIADSYYLWVTDKLTNPEFPLIKVLYIIDEENNTVTLIGIDDLIE